MQNGKKSGSALMRGATGDWEVVIGLEVHAQVASKSKLFSGASTQFGGEPNSHVSLVDAAMPGMLPVINEACIAQAVRTGLGLNAQINLVSVFDRKNYFYPDLPQGYQISQYKRPIVGAGEVDVDVDGETVRVGIERLHLEQDAGKSIHDQHPDYTYVDLNRSGVALMEIVSKPDMRSAKQAQAFISKVRTILRYLGTCDGDMEKGNLRADVNVSVRKPGAELGTRCEIKNVNSIRFIGQAVEAEARRQIDIIEDGGAIEQETRLFDPAKGETRSMRSKEEAHDYRYFPDPDLLPLELTQDYIDGLKKDLPELPDAKKARFMRDFKLSTYDADVLVAERESADFFETVAKGRDGKSAANWVINELFGRLNKEDLDVGASPVSAAQLGAIIDLIASSAISGKIAKDVFEIVWNEGGDPTEIVEKRGLKQVTDTDEIEKIVQEIIRANPERFAQLSVKPALLGWFVGQVMKATGGKANPRAVNETLKGKLDLSAELVPGVGPSILDRAAIKEFRAKWRRKSGNVEIDSWDDARLLGEADLTIDGVPTFAALVLLGTQESMAQYLANAEAETSHRHFV
jgi:aspartyl-tRNA(Asn)/glutamyl-tRNA(Gln) amidotransferase subunit B